MQTFISQDQKAAIEAAITKAEKQTSGEIRLHIEEKCKINPVERAAYIFETLEMHKTELHNGVLFYISWKDNKFAIIGDKGIHEKVGNEFWDSVKDTVIEHFKKQEIVEGLTAGILLAGEKLQTYFPCSKNDVNELSNEVSFS